MKNSHRKLNFGGPVGDSVGGPVRDSVWDSVWDSVRGSVRDSVWNSVRDSVRGPVWNSVRDSVRGPVWNSVRGSVRGPVERFVNKERKGRLMKAKKILRKCALLSISDQTHDMNVVVQRIEKFITEAQTDEEVDFEEIIKLIRDYKRAAEKGDGDEIADCYADLFCAMDDVAPEGTFFGPHPSDGANFGFWDAPNQTLECMCGEDLVARIRVPDESIEYRCFGCNHVFYKEEP